MMIQILQIIEISLFVVLALNIVYIVIFSFAGSFYKKTDFTSIQVSKQNKFVILIPAYQSDEVIINTVFHALKQNYPSHLLDIVVIADKLQPATIEQLLTLPIKIVEVDFESSTKAKSINAALSLLPNKVYDYCVVLDVDNVLELNFLNKINARLQNNEIAIQGHRTAKNLDSTFAILDGISEEINNHIFRRGHVSMGLSSALSGSGQAINYEFYKDAMLQIESPVEDKELEFYLIRKKVKVLFEDDALVYDEKVQNSNVFLKQRKRWIASQFFDFNTVFIEGIINLITKGSVDFFDKALQRILLPRVLLLGFTFLSSAILFLPFTVLGSWFFILFILCAISYLIAVPSYFFTSNTLFAAFRLPHAFLIMVLAFFKSKGASKVFLHTQHSSVIDTNLEDVNGKIGESDPSPSNVKGTLYKFSSKK